MHRIRSIRAWTCVSSLVLGAIAACRSGDDGGEVALSPELQAQWEKQRPAAELAAQASRDFEGYVASGNANPVEALMSSLAAKPEVANVTFLEVSGTVVGELRNGVAFNVLLADKARKEWTSPSSGSPTTPHTLQPLDAASSIQCDPTTFPQSKKACIVSGFTASFGQDLSPVRSALERAGFAVTDYALKTAQDVKTLRDALGSCGVLYISSHGSVARNIASFDPNAGPGLLPSAGNHVVTEIETSAQNFGRLSTALGPAARNNTGIGSLPPAANDPKSYYSLSPEFFTGVTYPNTMVYVDACSSDEPVSGKEPAGGIALQLRDVFRGNGAGAYFGWEAPVSARLANPATAQLFDGLAPKVATIDSARLVITPPKPGPGESYVPSASISPPAAGVELRLTVRGTDNFSRDEKRITDASGQVTFDAVPGAQGGIVDTVTLSAGGADNSSTAIEVVQNNRTLESYRLAWLKGDTGAAQLRLDANANFNLVCANQKLTQTQSVVKF